MALGGLEHAARAPGGVDAIVDRAARGEATDAERLLLAHGALAHVRAHTLERRGRLVDAIADAQEAVDAVRCGWEPELPSAHAVLRSR